MKFDGKVAVVTGASQGIGYHLAAHLASRGCKVYSIDKVFSTKKIEGVTSIRADITRQSKVLAAAGKIKGKVDLLVNNAGALRRGSLMDTSEKDFDLMIDVNLKAQWLVLKAFAGKLSKDAAVVQISSRHALELPIDPAIYAVGKRASIALAEVFKKTFPHLDVRVICPGPTDTMLARHGLDKKTLSKKFMHSPDFVAGNIMEFLSTEYKMLLYDSTRHEYYYR